MTRLWCLDTNILISGLVFRGPEHELIRWLHTHREAILWFPTLENEVVEVLHRKFSTADIHWAEIFPPGTRKTVEEPSTEHIGQAIDILRDPKDGPILATARFYEADYLVTGDKDLLVLADAEDRLHILTTKEALSLTRRE